MANESEKKAKSEKGGFFRWLFSKIKAFFGFGEQQEESKGAVGGRDLELERKVEEAESEFEEQRRERESGSTFTVVRNNGGEQERSREEQPEKTSEYGD